MRCPKYSQGKTILNARYLYFQHTSNNTQIASNKIADVCCITNKIDEGIQELQ